MYLENSMQGTIREAAFEGHKFEDKKIETTRRQLNCDL